MKFQLSATASLTVLLDFHQRIFSALFEEQYALAISQVLRAIIE